MVDCRTEGCGKNAECIREDAFFVCRCLPGFSGRPDVECQSGESLPEKLYCLKTITIIYVIFFNCIQYKKAFRSNNAIYAFI